MHPCSSHELGILYCTGLVSAATVDVMFMWVCLPHLKILCQRTLRKVIWSSFADLADMECTTFLEFREENQLKPSNANQIYVTVAFVKASIHDSSWPLQTNLCLDFKAQPFLPFCFFRNCLCRRNNVRTARNPNQGSMSIKYRGQHRGR